MTSRTASAGAVIAAVVVALMTPPVRAASKPLWTVLNSANPSRHLNMLDATSASSGVAWSVGRDTIKGRSRPLIERLVGSHWVRYPAKARSGDNELDGVATLSKKDAWAVGTHTNNEGGGVLVQHFNGKNWSNVSAPHTAIKASAPGKTGDAYGLQAVAASSAKSVWAVGSESCEAIQCAEHPFTEHYNGKHWSTAKTPDPGHDSSLTGVATFDSHHAWAVGFNAANGRAVMLGYNGKRWRASSIPEPGDTTQLFGVTARNPNTVWAVGSYSVDSQASRTLTLHRVNGVWRKVASPNPLSHGATLRAVTALSPSNVWAVGEWVDAAEIEHPLIEHYNGRSWSLVVVLDPTLFSNTLAGVTARSSGKVLAVGTSYATGTTARTLALRANL